MPVPSWSLWLDLQRAANQAQSALKEKAASLELRPVDMSVLVNVEARPGLTAKALASATGLKASTLNGPMNRLESLGLLERDRGHGVDRREVDLRLTPEGKERATQARDAMSRYRSVLLASSVSPEDMKADMKAFGRVLSAIARNAATEASSA
jgi:DNA-binding MarR family transcriptional regulator